LKGEGGILFRVVSLIVLLDVFGTVPFCEFNVVCKGAAKVSSAILVRHPEIFKLSLFWHRFKNLIMSSINLEIEFSRVQGSVWVVW
jgi:hypothetical protein